MFRTIVQTPFIRLLIALSTGIYIRDFINIPSSLSLVFLILTLGAIICLTIFSKVSENFRFSWIFGVLVHLFLITFAILISSEVLFNYDKGLSARNSPIEITGTILEQPQFHTKSVQCYLLTGYEKDSGYFKEAKEKILVNFERDSLSLALRRGDEVLINGLLQEVYNSSNPYEFDIKFYLHNKGVRNTVSVASCDWKYLDHKNLPVIYQRADEFKRELIKVFFKTGIKNEELSIASSLVFGDQLGLSSTVIRKYNSSGLIYFMSVTGMNVGLIYGSMFFLLVFLDRFRFGKFIKLLIIISIIWTYAIVTGLSEPVVRTSIIFTFIIIGELINRPSHFLNSLAISAFLLLIINPGDLFEIGFQLTYLSLISIYIFYPFISKLLHFSNKALIMIWVIIAVSIALEIGTFPLSIYYFHQFPILYFLSSLLIIPLSALISYLAIIAVFVSSFSWMVYIPAKILYCCLWLLNKVVLVIESLQSTITHDSYISLIQMVLLYMILYFGIIYLKHKRHGTLIICFEIILLILGLELIKDIRSIYDKEVIVYNEYDNTILQFRNGKQSFWFVQKHDRIVDKLVNISKYGMRSPKNQVLIMDSIFIISNKEGIRINDVLWVHGNFIQFYSKRIAVFDSIQQVNTYNSAIPVNYLLIKQEPTTDFKNLTTIFKADTVIINSRSSEFRVNSFRPIFKDGNVNIYDTRISGALRIKL